jgi:hypothetical protein
VDAEAIQRQYFLSSSIDNGNAHVPYLRRLFLKQLT